MLPTIDECARMLHATWRKEREAAGCTYVLSELLPDYNIAIPWGDLPEIEKDRYRTQVRLVYAAISKINFKTFAED